ncbi:MAG: cation diffusion facilitator family transporter [Ruminococcus sp.]|nr:cation diffusion facilitator family transporter [Ruminococcus sp.]
MSDNITTNESRGISREKKIVRTSVIGILANVMLAGFKAIMGLLSHSIAITLDAVNNISDAASSVITIIGTKLAGKTPDKKHPFGYGRIEYLSAMIIAVIVLYAGVTSFVESIKKIITPETPDYTPVVLIIVAVAVLVKIVLGRYVKSVGEKINSESLVNSGKDATLDSVISASTLAAAAVYLIWGVSLEAWLGAVISIVIIKSGIEMLVSALSQILGESADAELAKEIKKTVNAFPEVKGVYDLVLHNYGPDRFNGSLHIEIPDTCSVTRADELIQEITAKVYQKYGIILTAISIYSINSTDDEYAVLRKGIEEIIAGYPEILEMHALSLKKDENIVRVDFVVSLDAKDRAGIFKEAVSSIEKQFPQYSFSPIMDTDFAEE